MLFKPDLVALILAGEKTQTRRVAGDDDRSTIFSPSHAIAQCPDMVQRGERVVWQVGRTYALQPGRGKHAVGRIRVTAIRYCMRAGDISDGDARAEGFSSVADFRATYAAINGATYLDRPCWVIVFALAKGE